MSAHKLLEDEIARLQGRRDYIQSRMTAILAEYERLIAEADATDAAIIQSQELLTRLLETH